METLNSEVEAHLASVKTFLSSLGLHVPEDIGKESYWARIHQEIAIVRGNPPTPKELADPMGEAMVDIFFSTPSIARKFLAADLPRLSQVLVALDTMPGFPKNPQTIAEIGGGPGIATLWMARKFPDARCVVYDQSEKALAVGRHWADQLNIGNVTFKRATYHALAEAKPQNSFDLLLGLGALNLYIDVPHLSACIDPDSVETFNLEPMHQFAQACRSLLAPGGTVYFSQGSFNDIGILCLFNVFRKNRLSVDWSHTRAVGDGKGPDFSIKAMHLFLKDGHCKVFKDAHEDLATFLYAAQMSRFSDKIMVGSGDFETWLGLLSGGTRLARIQATRPDGLVERFSVYIKSGMLGFFSSNSRGSRAGFIYNAASFEAMVNHLKTIATQYRDQGVTLNSVEWHKGVRQV